MNQLNPSTSSFLWAKALRWEMAEAICVSPLSQTVPEKWACSKTKRTAFGWQEPGAPIEAECEHWEVLFGSLSWVLPFVHILS